jgi:hypothetical protein
MATTTPVAQGTVAGEFGEDEGEEAQHHGAATRDDRGPGTAKRVRHRVPTAFNKAQFIAIAGDEEQGVVGSGTKYQHREDASD